MTMRKELRAAFEQLKAEAGISEAEMIACWLEFIADRQRDYADAQTTE